MSASSLPIFSLEDISFSYQGENRVFENMNFALNAGEQLGLYGHNGCGKTTFFRLIAGLEKPDSGRVLFHGQPLCGDKEFRALRSKVGFVLQHADDQLFCPTVLEDVAFGPLNLGFGREEAARLAKAALESVGLGGFAERLTHRLSGGEKKLVCLAGVLVMQPEALLLDEPTAELDCAATSRLARILNGLETARIVISHDLDFLKQVSRRILTVSNGRVVDWNPEQEQACSPDCVINNQ